MLDRVGREELHRDRDVAEGEVEVDQADLAAPPSVRASARLTDIVVLPTPPLGDQIVITLPGWLTPPGPRRAE